MPQRSSAPVKRGKLATGKQSRVPVGAAPDGMLLGNKPANLHRVTRARAPGPRALRGDVLWRTGRVRRARLRFRGKAALAVITTAMVRVLLEKQVRPTH